MRLFINLSNLKIGGAIQVAHSFIFELNDINFLNNTYLICCNRNNYNNYNNLKLNSNFKIKIVDQSPSNPFIRKKIINKLNLIEKNFQPNIVFTLFGPSYWIPNSIHICGFADGWVYNLDSIVYKRLSFISRLKRYIINYYKIFRLKKESYHYILETNTAKKLFSKTLKINNSKISVVSNTINSVFLNFDSTKFNKPNIFKNNYFKLLTISSYYPHKNLEIINNVIDKLPKNLVKFYVTLPKKIYLKLFKNNLSTVINIGPISINDCPKYYYFSDSVFLPTLLETFSVSYLESMIMEKPILTSNYSFAKEICHNSAQYFDPLNSKDISDKIMDLINDKSRCDELVKNGRKIFKSFITPKDRAKQYIYICEKILKQNN